MVSKTLSRASLVILTAVIVCACRSNRQPVESVEPASHEITPRMAERIDRAVETCADIWDPRGRARETDFLVSVGRPAVPALISKLAELDLDNPENSIALEFLTEILQRITRTPKSTIWRRKYRMPNARQGAELMRDAWVEWWECERGSATDRG